MKENPSSAFTFITSHLKKTLNQDEFIKKRNLATDKIFDDLFQLEDNGKLIWERGGEKLQDFISTAFFENSEGEKRQIPLILKSSLDDRGHRGAYLYIGENEDICHNDADKRVAKLYIKITGKPFND